MEIDPSSGAQYRYPPEKDTVELCIRAPQDGLCRLVRVGC